MEKNSPSALEILMSGVASWNKWRKRNPDLVPSLDRVDLRGADLRGAILFNTNIRWADLTDANLEGAILYQTEFYRSRLLRCNLQDTDMRGAKLHNADMSAAALDGANLYRCDFINTILAGASFAGAYCGTTAFSNLDLSEVKGLDAVKHIGPSNIDLLTIFNSKGTLPYHFFSAAGVPNALVKTIQKYIPAEDGPRYHSCFISYSQKDEGFATKLYQRFRKENVTVWYAPEDVKAGMKLYDQIRQAIHAHDKLVIVLSPNSLKSNWVITELRGALQLEQQENRKILFPIALVPIEDLKKWQCFDSDLGKDIAVEVREYYIPDFSQWEDSTEFERQFLKLLNSLKLDAAKSSFG